MPKFMENRLSNQADKEGMTGKKKDHYIFGVMNNMSAMKGNQETAKGVAMQDKHDADMGHRGFASARQAAKKRKSFMSGE